MCGRYTLRTPLSQIAEYFDVRETIELPPRYNIAPTQSVPIVRLKKEGNEREIALLHWGLIPSWAKDKNVGNRNINARGETVAEKPTFRNAFRKRRCLVPADGFFEWKKTGGKSKEPHLIRLKSQEPFAFAGLWEIWGGPMLGMERAERGAKDEEGRDSEIESEKALVHSFTIITTEANDLLRPLHDRMPVILPHREHDAWLDRKFQDAAALSAILRPYPSGAMEHFAVSALVNSVENDTAECVKPEASQRTMF